MIDAIGIVLWFAFGALSLSGAALVVAALVAGFDRARGLDAIDSTVDARRVRAGRWDAVRRYARCWAISAAVWLVAALGLSVVRGG